MHAALQDEQQAPTSTGERALELQPPAVQKQERRPALPALTGLRTLLALDILLFHFTPAHLRWASHPWLSLYPLVDIGYVFVSFFFLISGFILSYNYAHKAARPSRRRAAAINALDFWMARLSRLYPVYALTMLISIPMLLIEWHVRSSTEFWLGAIATPLLLQGFFPHLATFWMTVTWTLSCEVVLYLAFPWLLKLKLPRRALPLAAMVLGFWALGLVPHTIYLFTNPDHLPHLADRYTDGLWLNVLKYTPVAYVCTFLAGLTLGRLHDALALSPRARVLLGLTGFTAAGFMAYNVTPGLPYIIVHGGLMTPIWAMVILGLAGPSWLAGIFSWRPLVAVGASTYALYLLHFNVFQLLQTWRVWQTLHLARFDPWISYAFIIALAVAVQRWVEHPAQLAIGNAWKRHRVRQTDRLASTTV
jgi:peptidoglycan/LPS O-acetylase OafA/YrhL